MAKPAPVFRHYEIVILVRPDLADSGREAVKDRAAGIIEEAGGRIARWETWGKRRLAYEIKKQSKAIYLYCSFVTAQSQVAELERNLRIMESVLKYQTVRLADAVLLDAFDFEAEAAVRSTLYMSPEEAAALERSYQRERDWATGSSRIDKEGGEPREDSRPERAPAPTPAVAEETKVEVAE